MPRSRATSSTPRWTAPKNGFDTSSKIRPMLADWPVRAAQRARRQVVPVAEQLDGVAHAHDEVVAHPGAAVDHARDRAEAHAGDRRHLAHRRPARAPALRGLRPPWRRILRFKENDLKGLTYEYFAAVALPIVENVVWRRGRRAGQTRRRVQMREGRTRFGRASTAASPRWRRSRRSASASSPAEMTTAVAAAVAAPARKEVTIGLITKTETNPFFVKMKEGAQAQAKKDNVKLLTGVRQDRHRQRQPGHGIREHDDAGRQGHPRRPRRLEGHRPRDQEGARRGRHRDRAGHADRAAGRGQRAVRDRQHEGRRADRPVRGGEGQGDGDHAEDRHDRPRPGDLRRPAAARRLPEGLRDQGGRSRRSSAPRRPRGTGPRPRRRWRTCSRRTRASTSSTRSTSRPRSAPPPR